MFPAVVREVLATSGASWLGAGIPLKDGIFAEESKGEIPMSSIPWIVRSICTDSRLSPQARHLCSRKTTPPMVLLLHWIVSNTVSPQEGQSPAGRG